jgi:hypothetical protein
VKWLADENLHNDIIRGLLRRRPDLDIVRAQDIPSAKGQSDLILLARAAHDDRILLTHDVSTMIPAMQEQQQNDIPCGFIVFVPDSMAIGTAIENILLLDECATAADWASGVLYLPLR